MATPIKPMQNIFVKNKVHELEKPSRIIAREIPEVILKLLKHIEDPDAKISLKACEMLLTVYAKYLDVISKDQIARLAASITYVGPQEQIEMAEEEEDNTPKLDFDTIKFD
jgi:hypothetical protein